MPSNKEVVDMVASGYEWICPECQELQTEIQIPETNDLTCQNCGANFYQGEAYHAK